MKAHIVITKLQELIDDQKKGNHAKYTPSEATNHGEQLVEHLSPVFTHVHEEKSNMYVMPNSNHLSSYDINSKGLRFRTHAELTKEVKLYFRYDAMNDHGSKMYKTYVHAINLLKKYPKANFLEDGMTMRIKVLDYSGSVKVLSTVVHVLKNYVHEFSNLDIKIRQAL